MLITLISEFRFPDKSEALFSLNLSVENTACHLCFCESSHIKRGKIFFAMVLWVGNTVFN